HRIAAEMDARNTASAALARRLGFRLEGHLQEHLYSKGEYTDTLIFGMLAGDLPGQGPAAADAETPT
ncbi:GNAT family N-acetyltransferase, partial [Glutamicibacter creatinolyticus]